MSQYVPSEMHRTEVEVCTRERQFLAVQACGNIEIAACHKTAFLCSREYPARAVLRSYDWARAMRADGVCVVSAFHSRLERDVLDILLAGQQPLILALARGLQRRYPPAIRGAIDAGRLLVLSPFEARVTRITAATVHKRNAFMLSIAERIVIGHINANGAIAQSLAALPGGVDVVRLSDEPPQHEVVRSTFD